MSEEGLRQSTARDVLPPVRRGRRTLPAGPAPLPTVVMVARPDRDAREWADLALASASELEESLDDERAAHAATREQLAVQRAAAGTALARAEAAEAALAEVRAREADQAVALDRALSERWRLQEELASMTEQSAAVDAHRQRAVRDLHALQAQHEALEQALADRDGEIAALEGRIATSDSAVLQLVEQRNKALEDSTVLAERLDALHAQLERVREAAR